MKKFTVDRKKWARGGWNGTAKLLNDTNTMCCLGFWCEQIAQVPRACMLNHGLPYKVLRDERYLSIMEHKLSGVESQRVIANINDHRDYAENIREELLTEMFAKFGYEVEFIN